MKNVYITRPELLKPYSMILFNNITNVDEDFCSNNYELFGQECEECQGTGEKDGVKCEECYGDGRIDFEVYQYFIIDVNKYDIEKLEEWGVKVGYSELLDLYILPIYDFGTGWNAFSYSKETPDDYILADNETLTCQTPY